MQFHRCFAPLFISTPLSKSRPQVFSVLPIHRLQRVQGPSKNLHPVEDQVVGFAKTLKEVVQLLSLNPSIVVISLAEPKADLKDKFNC